MIRSLRSLRARVVLLVVSAVVGTLLVIGLGTPRLARRQFEATVTELDRTTAVRPPLPALEAALRAGGWDEVRRRLAAVPLSDAEILVVDRDGLVVAARNPALAGLRAAPAPGGGWIVDSRGAGEAVRMVLRGGAPLVSAAGDTAGWAFMLPVADAHPADAGEAFSASFDRRFWLLVGLVLAAATALAVAVSARVVEPLTRLAAAARGIAAGDLATRVGPAPTTELALVARAFDDMAAALERSEAERRRMIRDVAHELRAPLTNLRGQLESMQDGLRPTDGAGLVSLLEESALLERLVADLGQLAEADAGRLDVRPQALELEPEVRRTVDAFVQAGRAPAGRITCAVPAGLVVHADAPRLGQILRNLIENALVHAPGSPVRIEAGTPADRAAGERSDDALVELAVTDEGPGIAPEHVPFVFDRLYRADPSRTRATGGAGLGLAIVRELVEAHGGRVGVERTPAGGARVWLTLPGTARDAGA